jgi:hypothetical protein
MKVSLVKGAVLGVFCFLLAGVAKADTTCNYYEPPNVCYTFTIGSDGGGVFDGMMEVTSSTSPAGFAGGCNEWERPAPCQLSFTVAIGQHRSGHRPRLLRATGDSTN